MVEKVVGLLESLLRLNRATESLLVDLVAAVSPWLAPMLPAYITWYSLTTQLKFPEWVALVSALVVELVGLSSVATALMLWSWNETKREVDQNAPVWLAIFAAVFYVAIVLTVNTMLDMDPVQFKVAKALLSCLSIVAAVIIAVRGQHARRQAEREREKAERREERREERMARLIKTQSEDDQKVAETFGKFPKVYSDWRQVPEVERVKIAAMMPEQIEQEYNVSERVSHYWAKRAKEYNGNHREHLSEN